MLEIFCCYYDRVVFPPMKCLQFIFLSAKALIQMQFKQENSYCGAGHNKFTEAE